MKDKQAQELISNVVLQIFSAKSPWNLQEFMEKFAFDIKLPVRVNDSITGEETWAESMNSARFITMQSEESRETWM